MLIIGEKINTSIKSTRIAVESKNTSSIKEIAQKQVDAGAGYLDINCGTFVDDEHEKIKWLVEVVQSIISAPLCIDSPNAKAVEAALKVNRNGKPIINSITAEKERWESILPLVCEYNTSIIALCMDDNGIPEESEERLRIALKIADSMAKKGINSKDIYFDPMVNPISTDTRNGIVTLETIKKVKREIPKSHIVCGLSNVSYGLPARRLINQAFAVAAIVSGLDTAIIDPLDSKLTSMIFSAEALAGKDEYCMEYINRYRNGLMIE